MSGDIFESGEGFGGMGDYFSGQTGAALSKALSSGEEVDIPVSITAGDGYALKLQDLQRVLVNTSFTEEEFQFFRRITKEGAAQTVTQYSRVLSHGDDWGSGVIAEDEAPEDGSSSFERVAELVRYFGEKGGVTLPMAMSQTIEGEAMGVETSERTLNLLRKVERAMYYGDNALDSKQMSGLRTLMLAKTHSDLIIDLRGRLIQREDITGAMAKCGSEPFYGRPTEAHMNLEVLEGLHRSMYPKERIQLPAPNAAGELGIAIEKLRTSRGLVSLIPSVFINDQLPIAPTVAVGTTSKRPVAPVITTGATRTGSAPGSKFSADDAGDYIWWVAAANRYGRSVAVNANVGAVALAVLKDDKVDIVVSGGSGPDPMWYEFYRTKKGGSVAQLVRRIPAAAAGAATTYTDKNEYLPGTSSCFLIENRPQALALRQLGPMMRILMAVRAPVFEFMLLLFIVVLLKAPNKHVLFLNAGHPTL